MGSLTHWGRLEPRCRADNFEQGLRAQVRDPLWMLARQWQFGEFDADDGGSPVVAEIAYGQTPLTTLAGGRDGTPVQLDQDGGPLEAVVEREPVALDLRTRTQAGLHFARLLRRRLVDSAIPALLDAVALGPAVEAPAIDEPSVRFATSIAGRVIDGGLILQAINSGESVWQLAASGTIAESDRDAVDQAAADLADWFRTTYGPQAANTAWNPQQFEYEFAVSPALMADEYAGDRLDWYDVDLVGPPPVAATTATGRFLPTPVKFHGMPASRWWEFEDGVTDFGAIKPNTTDLAKLLLAEFALIYADDWFLTPLRIPNGSLIGVTSLVVTDTFGERTAVVAAGSRTQDSWQQFSLFRLSRADPPGAGGPANTDLYFAAPATAAAVSGRPVEEVVLFRDEMANLAWGIEQTLPSGLCEPASGFDAYLRNLRGSGADSQDSSDASQDALRYRLMTDVAENWLPFQAVRDGTAARTLALELTPFLRETSDGELVGVTPKGEILRQPGQAPYRVDEEAIPLSARRITRGFQRVRTSDGRTHVWLGRQRSTTRAPGSSGLEFDQL